MRMALLKRRPPFSPCTCNRQVSQRLACSKTHYLTAHARYIQGEMTGCVCAHDNEYEYSSVITSRPSLRKSSPTNWSHESLWRPASPLRISSCHRCTSTSITWHSAHGSSFHRKILWNLLLRTIIFILPRLECIRHSITRRCLKDMYSSVCAVR